MKTKKSHFKGLSALQHLIQARKKGANATCDFHAMEAPGHISAACDSAKDTCVYALFLYILCTHLGVSMQNIYFLLASFTFGLAFWKSARSFHLGWARLSRIDKLVKEEKYEIENNREEEREELTEMYQAKGFKEPLLTKIIDVLMSDDNKLLEVMLDEELGVRVNSYVHPLKQAFGALCGVIISMCGIFAALALFPTYGLYIFTFLITGIAAYVIAKIERLNPLDHVVHGLSVTFLAVFVTLFMTKFFATS